MSWSRKFKEASKGNGMMRPAPRTWPAKTPPGAPDGRSPGLPASAAGARGLRVLQKWMPQRYTVPWPRLTVGNRRDDNRWPCKSHSFLGGTKEMGFCGGEGQGGVMTPVVTWRSPGGRGICISLVTPEHRKPQTWSKLDLAKPAFHQVLKRNLPTYETGNYGFSLLIQSHQIMQCLNDPSPLTFPSFLPSLFSLLHFSSSFLPFLPSLSFSLIRELQLHGDRCAL